MNLNIKKKSAAIFSLALVAVIAGSAGSAFANNNVPASDDVQLAASYEIPVASAGTATTTKAAAKTVGNPYNKYVYNTLSADEKKIYASIYDAVKNFKTTVTFDKKYPAATINKVYEHVFFQEADIFWFHGEVGVAKGTTDTINLKFKWDQKTAAAMQKKIDATVAAIKKAIPKGAPVTQQLKIMHDYIIQRTIFSKNNVYATSAYGPMAGGYGQCEGYAKTATYMCNQLGIENVRITGFNEKKATHAWNKVKVDGKWYNLDLTWDDPENHTRSTYYKNNYLLVPDAEINNKSHFPETTFKVPVANALDANYFVKYGYYVKDVNGALTGLKKQMDASVPYKLEVLQVKCTTDEVFNTLKSQLNKPMMDYMAQLNASASVTNKIAKLQVGHDPNTRVIQYNIVYK